MAVETESSFTATAPAPRWRSEPFRLFFPLGVILGWIGVSHWVLYFAGLLREYSCMLHGLVQMQAFMMAFALGFLLTALPRRTRSAPASKIELGALALALLMTAGGAAAEHWFVAEAGYAAQFLILAQFAIRRFRSRAAGRKPPAAFVLIPLSMLQGLTGAWCLARSSMSGSAPWLEGFGKLLVEQGVFLSFVCGVGSLILPLMAGGAPPADIDASPTQRRAAGLYLLCGVSIVATLVLEQLGWQQLAPILRGLVVCAAIGFGGGAWRPPGKPGLHRRFTWIAVWLLPLGLVLSGLFPDLRVPMLHITFVGGFGLLAFGVATHVALSHLDMQEQALGKPRAVKWFGGMFLLAMATRVASDLSHTYFMHLAIAATFWLIGSVIWLVFLGPALLAGLRDSGPTDA